MKKLNKALGRKRVIDLPDHDLIETFVRGRFSLLREQRVHH
jgi:hypothetical protein